jgi:hypothetical protein
VPLLAEPFACDLLHDDGATPVRLQVVDCGDERARAQIAAGAVTHAGVESRGDERFERGGALGEPPALMPAPPRLTMTSYGSSLAPGVRATGTPRNCDGVRLLRAAVLTASEGERMVRPGS